MAKIDIDNLLTLVNRICIDQNIKFSSPLNEKTFDMALIKPLKGSNTASKGSASSNQSSILLTGDQLTLFPVIKRTTFSDKTIGKNIIIKLDIELCSNNIDYSKNTFTTGQSNEFINAALTTNETTQERIELGCITLDDPAYVDFYNSFHENDYLIICKYFSELKYLFLYLKKSDACSYSTILKTNSSKGQPDSFTYFNPITRVTSNNKTALTYVSSKNYSYDITKFTELKINNTLTYDIFFNGNLIKTDVIMSSVPSTIVQHYINNLKVSKNITELSEIFKNVGSALNTTNFIISKDKIPTNSNRKSDYKLINYNGQEFGVYSEIYGSGPKENFLKMLSYFKDLKYDIVPHRVQGGINKIFLGPPGTGKSRTVHTHYQNTNFIRILFHPEYTYNDFIGYLKPCKQDNNISYDFVPGPFTEILASAINNPSQMFTLIIEEINRANTASVFGDIFQLLDRKENGTSEYAISNHSIANYIKENNMICTFLETDSIVLPSNLNIIATMNPADQNVFQMDTAFKRRWEFEYISVSFNDNHEFKDDKIPSLDLTWENFVTHLNAFMMSPQNEDLMITEDKQIGQYFIKKSDLSDSKKFAYKVLLYLWDDVFKGNRSALFNDSIRTFSNLVDIFISQNSINIFNDSFKGLLQS